MAMVTDLSSILSELELLSEIREIVSLSESLTCLFSNWCRSQVWILVNHLTLYLDLVGQWAITWTKIISHFIYPSKQEPAKQCMSITSIWIRDSPRLIKSFVEAFWKTVLVLSDIDLNSNASTLLLCNHEK
jgi:hypothetical protein